MKGAPLDAHRGIGDSGADDVLTLGDGQRVLIQYKLGPKAPRSVDFGDVRLVDLRDLRDAPEVDFDNVRALRVHYTNAPRVFYGGGSGSEMRDTLITATAKQLDAELLGVYRAARETLEPPRRAEITARWLMPKKDRDALLGDLIEEYRTKMLPRYGKAHADRWFWGQIARSLAPMLWSSFRKTAVMAAMLRGIEWLRSLV